MKKSISNANPNTTIGTLPWNRFWARWIDLFIHLLMTFFTYRFLVYLPYLSDLFPQNRDFDLKKYLFLMGITFIVFVIYETIFLCVFSATPGKALFRIRVMGNDGKRLNVSAAATRAVTIYWFVLYFYLLPTIGTIFGFWLSSSYYEKNGTFRWDKYSNCIVFQEPLTRRRRSIAILFSVLCITIRHIPEFIFLYKILTNYVMSYFN